MSSFGIWRGKGALCGRQKWTLYWKVALGSFLIPLLMIIHHPLAELFEETKGMDVTESISSLEAFHWS